MMTFDWLLREKERRGIAPDQLLFIGMHNIAQYFWCPMYSVLKSRTNEMTFFLQYLALSGRFPKGNDDIFSDIGNGITFQDLDTKFKKENPVTAPVDDEFAETSADGLDDLNKDNKIKWKSIRPPKIQTVDAKYEMGHKLEGMYSEKYPKFEWYFEWSNYVVVGEPDGITDTFVYEFKTEKKGVFLNSTKTTAFAQLDLYGYFFQRDKKRAQIYVRDEDITKTWEEDVSKENAERLLGYFRSIDKGWVPEPPKQKGKCRICDEYSACAIRHQ